MYKKIHYCLAYFQFCHGVIKRGRGKGPACFAAHSTNWTSTLRSISTSFKRHCISKISHFSACFSSSFLTLWVLAKEMAATEVIYTWHMSNGVKELCVLLHALSTFAAGLLSINHLHVWGRRGNEQIQEGIEGIEEDSILLGAPRQAEIYPGPEEQLTQLLRSPSPQWPLAKGARMTEIQPVLCCPGWHPPRGRGISLIPVKVGTNQSQKDK